MLSKAELRKFLLDARMRLSMEERTEKDFAIGQRLLALLEANPVSSLGIYWPIMAEPDLRPAYEALTARGVELALPVVKEKNAPLLFCAWRPGDALERDAHKIPVPANQSRLVEPGMLLLPCVGFNARRFRLGYGAGYYDRTLASLLNPPRTAGIAYALCEAGFVEDAHDVAMDWVITEDGLE
ncbi:5-formyltetrahydrofolate cyclo-ligase [Noviherbaspirillum pedocola]|uniref:5-formyltetrahydrofolate cyclo-ligase n=1 Tax=Noviherbaspirillum pedocola TaxID=2801341 RepID=A0A934T0A5_9BURK|nr:5-formyltetrahydrofolate cyclo-ligase [Noviherbaspirillum pedocola]MBK4736382.1 5-formyltetrahydrofolate cyclo-ligase [Noviherbaspirillum pedocola]